MDAMSQDEDPANGSNNNFNPDELTTPEVVIDQLKTIAETGIVDINWPDLQRALKTRLRNVLDHYIERKRDSKEEQYQEPNVEKFNLENSRDEILELIDSFTEAPFTIQRICELLHSPFKYYDKISTFLRGLEKNLRVISSNNWPKSQVDSSLISNTKLIPSCPLFSDSDQPTASTASSSANETIDSQNDNNIQSENNNDSESIQIDPDIQSGVAEVQHDDASDNDCNKQDRNNKDIMTGQSEEETTTINHDDSKPNDIDVGVSSDSEKIELVEKLETSEGEPKEEQQCAVLSQQTVITEEDCPRLTDVE